MGRQARGWWDEKSGRWYARLGPPDEKGRPRPVMLRDERGEPIADPPVEGRGNRAVQRAVQRLQMERANRVVVHAGPTVREVCERYLEWHREVNSAPRTVNDHWAHLTRFCKFEHAGVRYEDRPACEIVPNDLWRIKRSGARGLRHLYMSVLACWAWAARPIEGRSPEVLIPSNPLAKVERPPKGAIRDKTIDWPEARVMLRLARAFARKPGKTRRERTRATRWIKAACLTAMAYTGGRTYEISMLRWEDIRWKEGIILIPPDRTKTRYTGRPRLIGVPPRLLKLLRVIERWPHRHPTLVFCCAWHSAGDEREHEFIRFVREDLKPWLAECWEARRGYLEPRGIRFSDEWTPYWFRHSYGTTALEEVGADSASKVMGNSAEIMRSTYDHVSARRARHVAAKVAEARRRREGEGRPQ